MASLTFQEVTRLAERSGTCVVCGRTTRRSQRFSQTVNPWNRNPDGSVRTVAEVRAAVQQEADEWVPDFRHEACREVQP